MREKQSSMKIQTPEGVQFSLLLAGPVTRFLAWIIDAGIIYVIVSITGTLLGLFTVVSYDLGTALYILAAFLLPIAYGISLEWLWRGQTIGKKVLQLRVVDVQGLRLEFSQVVIRNLLRAVDNLPLLYLTGGLACLASPKCQRLGDMAANTIVIRNPVTRRPDLTKLLPDKFNSLWQHPHLVARLRHKVTLAEASIALRSLFRRDDFSDEARVELFRELADNFRELVPFPPEAVRGLTDERYVTNVVEVLFSESRAKSKERSAKKESVEHRV